MSEIVFMLGILIYFILVVCLSARTHPMLYLFEKEEPVKFMRPIVYEVCVS